MSAYQRQELFTCLFIGTGRLICFLLGIVRCPPNSTLVINNPCLFMMKIDQIEVNEFKWTFVNESFPCRICCIINLKSTGGMRFFIRILEMSFYCLIHVPDAQTYGAIRPTLFSR